MSCKPIQHIKVGLDFGGGVTPVGDLAIRDHQLYFQYSSDLLREGYDLSPIRLPRTSGLITFDEQIFEGLPGVFNDSLPDGWGRLLFDRVMRRRGISLHSLSPLDRLAHVGHHGMGALVYEPILSSDAETFDINLDHFYQTSHDLLEGEASDILDQLLLLNGSSSGARPKALIGFNRETNHLIHGSQTIPKGYQPWIVKFANVHDGPDAGAMEYVYSQMAHDAGVKVPPTHLFPAKHGSGYFAVQRFDRANQGHRLHMHTACGLLHSDHRFPALDYKDLIELTMMLTQDVREVEQVFRLAVFNVMAHNRDDHSKNFSFLMDPTGEWKASPAYDLTFSMGPGGEQSTTVMGEGKSIRSDHLIALGKHAQISDSMIQTIIKQTKDSLHQWSQLSKNHAVSGSTNRQVQSHLEKMMHNVS